MVCAKLTRVSSDIAVQIVKMYVKINTLCKQYKNRSIKAYYRGVVIGKKAGLPRNLNTLTPSQSGGDKLCPHIGFVSPKKSSGYASATYKLILL